MSTVKGQEISSDPKAMAMNSLQFLLRLSVLRVELAKLADEANNETAMIIRYAARVLGLVRDGKRWAT